jgi:selenocysteine lyase/cysteine desulfurase
MYRREFLRAVGAVAATAASGSAVLSELEARTRAFEGVDARAIARDEDFWRVVRDAYDITPDFIHLESGWFSPVTRNVLEAQFGYEKRLNEVTSFYLRRQYDDEKKTMKRIVGEFLGLSPDEIVVCRNTTEALDTVILGLDLERGDEIVFCDREYPSMKDALVQRAERDGTVNRVIDVPMVPATDDEVIAVYEQAITSKTRAILVSHMIYLTGQILPVRRIVDMAHSRGVEVIVDAAHSVAHLDFRISDLGCDYLGSSLHKWLGAPLGCGLLYVRKDKIPRVWPLFADRGFPKDDIRKFEHIGTHPVALEKTLLHAIRFHESIGAKRKEERLRYLKNYWVSKVVDLPKVRIQTPLGDGQSCAIANVAIEGMEPQKVAEYFFERHRVFTVAVEMGVRVAPNLFTRLSDLDALAGAIRDLSPAA